MLEVITAGPIQTLTDTPPISNQNAAAMDGLGHIDQDEFGVLERAHFYHRLLADGGTVAGVETSTEALAGTR